MNVLDLDNRKKQLLEARLDPSGIVNGVMNSPPVINTQDKDIISASGVSTQLDVSSPKEVIVIDNISIGSGSGSRSAPGSRSNSRLSLKENKKKENNSNITERELGSAKRPLEFDGSNSFEAIPDKTFKSKRTDEDSIEPDKIGNNTDSGSRGAGGAKNTIKNYFISQNDNSTTSSFNHISTKENKETIQINSSTGTEVPASALMPPPVKMNINTTNKTILTTQQQHLQTILELKKQIDYLRLGKEVAESKITNMEEEKKLIIEQNVALGGKITKLTRALEDVHRTLAQKEFRRKRDKLAQDTVRLGKVVATRSSMGGGPPGQHSNETWDGGYRRREIERRKVLLKERKEELEARRKRIQTQRRAAKKGGSNASTDNLLSTTDTTTLSSILSQDAICMNTTTISSIHNSMSNLAGMERERDMLDNDMDLNTETEVIKIHLEQLKKDEMALAEEERQFSSERAVHHKELKRIHCEEISEIYKNDLKIMNKRYLPQYLLGRGGFSEVWKALDLCDIKEVAVKIHQLNNQWSEERKQNYIRHVTREYTIHRDMKHPRVVQLYDVFEIGPNSFATVLEFCKGIDLDEKLKRQKTIPEKDAKAIFMQIMSGLRYLDRPLTYGNTSLTDNNRHYSTTDNNTCNNEEQDHTMNTCINNNGTGHRVGAMNHAYKANKKLTIIHYDLKPANILFDEMGDVKITDFGLSKIIDETSEGTSMELTSQGAGTYWYLPPECFVKGDSARISSKVDVWSAGIIFYQMLYGCRPYGEGQSQERVWADGIIANAGEVVFPAVPKVSDEAKELIRACLTRDPRLRPDVVAVCQHSYLNK